MQPKGFIMNSLSLLCILLGIHIIAARSITGYISKYAHHWIVGAVEGVPLLLAGVLMVFQLPWAFTLFLFAFILYVGGSFLKTFLDNRAEKASPEKWQAWEQEKKKMNPLIRLLLLIF